MAYIPMKYKKKIQEPMELWEVSQWYIEPNEGYIYWLGDKDLGEVPFPVPKPQNIPPRVVLKTDSYDHQVTGPNSAGTPGKYRYVIPRYNAAPAKPTGYTFSDATKAWPSAPDFENLSALINKFTPELNSIVLDVNTALIRHVAKTDRDNTRQMVNLSVSGQIYMTWWEEYVQFVLGPNAYLNPDYAISVLKKYAGKKFVFEKHDDLWGVVFQKDWFPLFNQLYFALSQKEASIKPNLIRQLQRDDRQKNLIRRYMDGITAQTVLRAIGNWQPEDSIVYRCIGCMNADATHVRMHVLRNDLSLFMIYTSYKEFGNGGLDPGAWLEKFVKSVRRHEGDSTELPVFKKLMESWLRDCILQRNYFLRTHDPVGDFAQGWRNHGWKHSAKGGGPEPHTSTHFSAFSPSLTYSAAAAAHNENPLVGIGAGIYHGGLIVAPTPPPIATQEELSAMFGEPIPPDLPTPATVTVYDDDSWGYNAYTSDSDIEEDHEN
jgi:hypothetical protein